MIACARSANEPASRRELAVPRSALLGFEHVALHAIDRAAGLRQPGHAMAEAETDKPAALRLAHAAHERLDHARAGAPGDMEARHGFAVTARQIPAALGPADDRKNLQALLAQPGALLAGREVHIGLGPAARPVILRRGRTPPSRTSPAAQARASRGCAGGAARANRRRTIRRTTRTPDRRASLRLLIENDDAPARVGKLGGRDKTREARTDHDGVCVHSVPQKLVGGTDVRRLAERKTVRAARHMAPAILSHHTVLSVVPML